jgi:DNA-binding beta-propeller fold protein YncE
MGNIMKTHAPAILIALVISVLFLLLGPEGCARDIEKTAEPLPEMVWPPAPDLPRIKFVNAVTQPDDLRIKRGAFLRFFDYLSGKTMKSMVMPYGVETDSGRRLYVVDTFLRTIHVFDVKGNAYYSFPENQTTLTSPIDLAIENETGSIYVTDSQDGVVKIFKDAGKRFAGEIGRGVLVRPTGIAVNAKTSELLVVDTLSANVVRYALSDHSLVGIFGGTGSKEGQLHYPTNIQTTSNGRILVSDSLNFRIQVFSEQGIFLRRFGSAGIHPGSFSRPKGVAADSDGNIYVVDGLFDNIQVFDKENRLLMVFGDHGIGYGEFWLPSGIFIDANDTIYVADSYNRRIQVFQYLKNDSTP